MDSKHCNIGIRLTNQNGGWTQLGKAQAIAPYLNTALTHVTKCALGCASTPKQIDIEDLRYRIPVYCAEQTFQSAFSLHSI